MSLDKATVAKIARLARIRVDEAEQDSLAGELTQILSWIEQLDEVDTSNVEPMVRVGDMKLKKRKDEVTDGNCRDAVLANAPEARDGFFTVPKVVE
jgi:aspartyl-tRNA(Asn)/glutamyl-tRNA(Gln) amidotransferase subunit C